MTKPTISCGSTSFMLPLLLILQSLFYALNGQPATSAQVKITSQPFQVGSSQHLNQITWTMLGRVARETIYCVSESPVSQLRFVCMDCVQKNITDIVHLLNSAQDLTPTAGFPTVMLANVEANPQWTGLQIMCQAALNGGSIDSLPATIDVRYLKQVHIVDSNSQGPFIIPNQGNHFYVECVRGPDGSCQQSTRRKTLHCAVQAHPSPVTYRWLKNGGPISGNGPEITIGTEMIGQSLQCSANNGLYGDDMPTSQAVYIDPYTAARLISDNFQQLQSASPFSSGNRIEINQHISMNCIIEGNPRPVVYWKLRKTNGQVVNAACGQGYDGQYREVPAAGQPFQSNTIRLNAICDLHITNYTFSGQYWCSACSHISQGFPECAPGIDNPGERVLNVQVQGPPMQSETEPTVEQFEGRNMATVYVHYCAEPAPRLPRDVVFSIDGNDIQQSQTWQNFVFEGTTQNNTVPNCFFAKLRISPIQEDDRDRQIFLKVSNTYGSKQISVSLVDLLGGESSEIGGFPAWVFVLFAIIAVCLFLICSSVCYLKRHSLCGERFKDSQNEYSNDKLKSNHGYNSEDHGGLFNANGTNGSDEYIHQQIPPNTHFTEAYSNAYGTALKDSRMSSV